MSNSAAFDNDDFKERRDTVMTIDADVELQSSSSISTSSNHHHQSPPPATPPPTPTADPFAMTALEQKTVKAFKLVRIAVACVAAGLGFVEHYRLFAALVVFSLGGITGLEGLLVGSASARAKRWTPGSPYQKQAAWSALTPALVMIVLVVLGAADAALASVTLVVLTTTLLSAVHRVMVDLCGRTTATTSNDEEEEDCGHAFVRYILAMDRLVGAAAIFAVCLVVLVRWGVLFDNDSSSSSLTSDMD